MHSPAIAARAVAEGVCQDHHSDPVACGAQKDVALYAAVGVLTVVGVVAGVAALGRWLRD